MATLKNNRTRTGIALFFFFLLGAFFVVKAMDKNRDIAFEKQNATTKVADLFTFEYNGPDFSKANVENEANWNIASSDELCDGSDEVPCRIQVSQAYVNNPSSSPTLKSSANISASLNSTTGTHYVNGMADPSGVVSNREN